MPTRTTLRELPFAVALQAVDEGGAFLDLRPVDAYLEVHIPGSLNLVYEWGPGMAGRARDCLPLGLPLVILDPGEVDCSHAAASLRGKGFTVLGSVSDGINKWAAERGVPKSTEVLRGSDAPDGTILDVGDPGGGHSPNWLHIPSDRLWSRLDELSQATPIIVAAGYGVRAALALGVLEHNGFEDVQFWWTRG
jgi:rhodanese-related sulfurtransferase